jgi:hypothetical protein
MTGSIWQVLHRVSQNDIKRCDATPNKMLFLQIPKSPNFEAIFKVGNYIEMFNPKTTLKKKCKPELNSRSEIQKFVNNL